MEPGVAMHGRRFVRTNEHSDETVHWLHAVQWVEAARPHPARHQRLYLHAACHCVSMQPFPFNLGGGLNALAWSILFDDSSDDDIIKNILTDSDEDSSDQEASIDQEASPQISNDSADSATVAGTCFPAPAI